MSAVRAVWVHAVWWTFTALWTTAMALAMAVTLGRHKATLGAAMMRCWGRVTLAVAGVRLDVDPALAEDLRNRRGRVLVFNHSSTLDLLVGSAIMPPGGVTIAKQEMKRVPIIGWVMRVLDILFIDRGDHAAATASLNAAAARIARERLTIVAAPEGTRSADGSLGPFKMGPFHMAAQAQVPVVALLWVGCPQLWPRKTWVPRSGVVRIVPIGEFAPVPVAEVRAQAERVRDAFVAALARWQGGR
ncbi:MAG: 1-acyl-sn-glycerol-3-phosphate acyltransferase [Deltaproteobacteria bacterium]|nr:1-acyl-sn-glycerol-3-phosphate acyltransferase [Deltaproteobacteria bacterium]